MKNYVEPVVTIYAIEIGMDVVTLSVGTSDDNNYDDIDWEFLG